MANKKSRNLRPIAAEEPKIKTTKDWTSNFDNHFFPGDRVSEEIALHFAEVVAPTTAEENFIQCGEPTDLVNGRYTYTTFIFDGRSWVYCGNCHQGEKEEPEVKGHGEQL